MDLWTDNFGLWKYWGNAYIKGNIYDIFIHKLAGFSANLAYYFPTKRQNRVWIVLTDIPRIITASSEHFVSRIWYQSMTRKTQLLNWSQWRILEADSPTAIKKPIRTDSSVEKKTDSKKRKQRTRIYDWSQSSGNRAYVFDCNATTIPFYFSSIDFTNYKLYLNAMV
jgi:hypothetical protein